MAAALDPKVEEKLKALVAKREGLTPELIRDEVAD